jgi:hypothetical protein
MSIFPLKRIQPPRLAAPNIYPDLNLLMLTQVSAENACPDSGKQPPTPTGYFNSGPISSR